MDDEVATAAALTLCAIANYNYVSIKHKMQIKKKWNKKRWWMTSIHRNRTSLTLERQLNELLSEPSGEFRKFTRMSYEDFNYLLNEVSPMIAKRSTRLREAIPARVRLAITLRFLASGDSFQSLHFLFRVSPQLISEIIPEVCHALNEVLKEEIKIPSCAEEWLEIEKGFASRFPRAIGAIDGKHIVLECPHNSGSNYFNYKKSFSIVLLAVVDSTYKFIFADIGCQGRISDGGVFSNSLFWQKICSNDLNLPSSRSLPGLNIDVPYVFLGDGAFALTEHVMKPYPGNHDWGSEKRTFNSRLSSARVVVENTFGILASKFRIFRKAIKLCPEKVSLLTMTCILLHNYLRSSATSSSIYTPPGTIDVYDNEKLITPGSWRDELETTSAFRDLPHIPRRSSLSARKIREEFTNYFSNLG